MPDFTNTPGWNSQQLTEQGPDVGSANPSQALFWLPTDSSLKGASCELEDIPATAASADAITAGKPRMTAVKLNKGTVTNLGVLLKTNATTATNTFFALTDIAGNVLAVTADQSTAINNASNNGTVISAALATAYPIKTPGTYYVAFLVGAAGAVPTLGAVAPAISINTGITASASTPGRSLDSGTGSLTSLTAGTTQLAMVSSAVLKSTLAYVNAS